MELEQMNDEEILNEAIKQGFNPDYEGENKKSPKEYLEVSFNHNKMLRERNDKLSQEIEALNSKMNRLVEFQTEQKQKAVNAAVASLKEQRKEAITDGDVEKVEKIDQAIEAEQNVAIPQSNPILEAWMARNPWYESDRELAIESDIIAKQLHDTGRFQGNDRDYKELLQLVEKKVKAQFPEKFKNPRKDDPPEVEDGKASSPSTSQSKKTYADLPPEAKRACDQFVNDKTLTREQYLEIYEWE